MVAVWYQYDGARTNIWSNRYEVGRGWGGAELIETEDTGDADSPRVAVGPRGTPGALTWR